MVVSPFSVQSFYFMNGTPRGELGLTPSAQQEHRILNGTASVEPGDPTDQVKSTFELIDTAMQSKVRAWEKGGMKGPHPIAVAAQALGHPISGPPRFFHLKTRQEQAPNPDSRVTLSTAAAALYAVKAVLSATMSVVNVACV